MGEELNFELFRPGAIRYDLVYFYYILPIGSSFARSPKIGAIY